MGENVLPNTRNTEYDVALSFAGEDREYVVQVAASLSQSGVKVFYDEFEEIKLWGKNLYEHFSDVYQHKVQFVVLFLSEHYKKKTWTRVERQAVQANAFRNDSEYILPVRFDDTEIDGILDTVGYLDLRKITPNELSDKIKTKLIQSGRSVPSELFRTNTPNISLVSKRVTKQLHINVYNSKGDGVANANIVLSADNGTYLSAKTNKNGKAIIHIDIIKKYTVLIAHENHASVLIPDNDLSNDINVNLQESKGIGSIIIQNTGYISNLSGRLNPINDSSKHTYLYADNIAINGGVNQPVSFEIDEILTLEDNKGTTLKLIFKFINGRTTALIDYIIF